MGWIKSEYEGRVCWENNGERVFDRSKLFQENNTKPIQPINIPISFGLIMYFLIGVIVGLAIGTLI